MRLDSLSPAQPKEQQQQSAALGSDASDGTEVSDVGGVSIGAGVGQPAKMARYATTSSSLPFHSGCYPFETHTSPLPRRKQVPTTTATSLTLALMPLQQLRLRSN